MPVVGLACQPVYYCHTFCRTADDAGRKDSVLMAQQSAGVMPEVMSGLSSIGPVRSNLNVR